MTQKYVYEGYGIDDLRIYLEKTYGMKKKWYFIRNCLINKRNIGIFEYRGVEYDDVVPAIIDKDLYDKAVEKQRIETYQCHIRKCTCFTEWYTVSVVNDAIT